MTSTAHMSFFEPQHIQIKLKFQSKKVILLSEVSHVLSDSNHANELKTFSRERMRNDVTRKRPLLRGRSNSENLNFSALLCEQMLNEKERQTTK